MSDLPQTKAELITRMDSGLRALKESLNQLSEAQIVARSTPAAWSIKDHMAHLIPWVVGMTALLRRENRWTAMRLDEKLVKESEGFDEINHVLYEQYQDWPLAKILAALQTAHQDLVNTLNGLTDADLFKPYGYYESDETDSEDQRPIIGWLVGNTYDHYAEHQGYIEELVANHE